jgi:hypothetical protein
LQTNAVANTFLADELTRRIAMRLSRWLTFASAAAMLAGLSACNKDGASKGGGTGNNISANGGGAESQSPQGRRSDNLPRGRSMDAGSDVGNRSLGGMSGSTTTGTSSSNPTSNGSSGATDTTGGSSSTGNNNNASGSTSSGSSGSTSNPR